MSKKLKLSALILSAVTLLNSQTSAAQASINDMQTCQGLIDFVTLRLDSLPSKYNEDDVAIVQKGLSSYNSYIQNTIVSPGLLQVNNGDDAKANEMQKAVDSYKGNIVKQYLDGYPYNKLSMDFAVSLDKCAQKSLPAGNDLALLKASLLKMVELIKSQ